MVCNVCGCDIEPGARVCSVCGTAVNVETATDVSSASQLSYVENVSPVTLNDAAPTLDMSPAIQQHEVKVAQKVQIPDLRTLHSDELSQYLAPLLQPLKQIDAIDKIVIY